MSLPIYYCLIVANWFYKQDKEEIIDHGLYFKKIACSSLTWATEDATN